MGRAYEILVIENLEKEYTSYIQRVDKTSK